MLRLGNLNGDKACPKEQGSIYKPNRPAERAMSKKIE